MDYIKSLGVGAVWLSPVYTSAMVDFGYDVIDHCDIDPVFGSMDDMIELIESAHSRGRPTCVFVCHAFVSICLLVSLFVSICLCLSVGLTIYDTVRLTCVYIMKPSAVSLDFYNFLCLPVCI